jgi:hypothetical protein
VVDLSWHLLTALDVLAVCVSNLCYFFSQLCDPLFNRLLHENTQKVGGSLAYFLAAALTLAQRALAAALILAMPAGEIRRLGRAVLDAVRVPFCFAQRARWAAAMRRRAEADMIRAGAALGVLPLREVRAWIAWSMRARSSCSSLMTPSRFGMSESVTSQFGWLEEGRERN